MTMKIVCIGKNYGAEKPEEPIFFLKPDTALLRNNEPFYVPAFSAEMAFECEVVVRIDRLAKCVEERFAPRCYHEIGLGIDFTARDILRRAQQAGLPWERAKAFDHSAAVSPEFVPYSGGDVEFEMLLNGEVRQRASTGEMIFGINKLISYVSDYVTFKIGDLLFTGTPAGVDVVHPGDRITARLGGQTLLDFEIR